MRHAIGEDEAAVTIGDVRFVFGQVAAVIVGAIDEFDAQAIDGAENGIDAVGAFDLIGKKCARLLRR